MINFEQTLNLSQSITDSLHATLKEECLNFNGDPAVVLPAAAHAVTRLFSATLSTNLKSDPGLPVLMAQLFNHDQTGYTLLRME